MAGRRTIRMTTLSSREFNQDTGRATKAAKRGPVFITDRGRPAHVLLTIEDYQRLVEVAANIIDLLALPGADAVELEVSKISGLYRAADLLE